MTQPALFGRVASVLAAVQTPIVVTGGSGWLGLATLDLLDAALGPAFAQRVHAYAGRARDLRLRSGRDVPCRALPALADYAGPPPLVLHYACLTKDRVEGKGAIAFQTGNAAIRDAVTGLIRRRGARGLFLPSSGAVYGSDRSLAASPAGNPYGADKLLDEARFAELATGAGAPCVIARVFNLAGPRINKLEAYALAAFVVALLADRPIEIQARGRVVRSYVHVEDLLLLALGSLLLAPAAEPVRFDTEGELAIEVQVLARRAATLLGRADVPISRAAPDGRPDDVYVGDGTAMRALAEQLGLPLRELDVQIRDTAADLAGAQ